MDAVQCIKQILKVKLTDYIVIKKTMYKWPSLTSETQTLIYTLNHNKIDKSQSLVHVRIALLSHLLTHSLTHSLPLAYMATSGNTEQCSMTTGRVPP